MPLQLKVTNAGRAALVAAGGAGTAAVTIAQIGISGVYTVPSAAATTLPGEAKRIAGISGAAVSADTIHMVARDESADTYTVRSIALYLGDGTLFAVYGQPDPLIEKSTSSMVLMAIDVRFADIAASTLAFGDANFLNPPATTETRGVVELATPAETQAGTDVQRAVTPAGLASCEYARLRTNVVFRDARMTRGAEGGVAYFGTGDTYLRYYEPAHYWQLVGGPLTVYGELYSNGSAVWHTGNDGAGSGLDADMVDGRQASDFALLAGASFTGLADGTHIRARGNTPPSSGAGVELQYVGSTGHVFAYDRTMETYRDITLSGAFVTLAPSSGKVRVNGGMDVSGAIARAGFTLWDAGNDGAGSGLDADMVDGYQASAFALLTGASFTGTIAAPSATVNGGSVWHTANDGAGSGLDADTVDGYQANAFALLAGASFTGTITAPSATVNGGSVWHSSNDGAGSGLDADSVDGYQASELARLTGAEFTGAVTLVYEAPTLNWVNPGLTIWSAKAVGTSWQLQLAQAGTAMEVSNELDVTVAARLSRRGSGQFLHHADPAFQGDSITCGSNAPSGGSYGDIHIQTIDGQPNRVWIYLPGGWR